MTTEIIPNGSRAEVTEDWSFTSERFGDTHSGVKGTVFTNTLYIPVELSDSGFAFYRGVGADGKEVLCPADKARRL